MSGTEGNGGRLRMLAGLLPTPLREALETGRLVVSATTIDAALRLKDLSPLTYEGCEASARGLTLSLKKSTLGVVVAYRIGLRVTELTLNDLAPRARFEVTGESLEGEGFLGRLGAAVVGKLVDSLFESATKGLRGEDGTPAVRLVGERLYELDLRFLPRVRQLTQLNIPLVGTPIVTLLPSIQVEHVDDGVAIVFRRAP